MAADSCAVADDQLRPLRVADRKTAPAFPLDEDIVADQFTPAPDPVQKDAGVQVTAIT
jgi:hypothetical protein